MVRLSVKVTFEGMEYEGTYLIIRTFEVPSYSMYLRTFEGTNEGTFEGTNVDSLVYESG